MHIEGAAEDQRPEVHKVFWWSELRNSRYFSCLFKSLYQYNSRFVSCRDRRMSVIPSDAPADTVKFRLEKTAISRVPRAAFFYLSELQYLWLTYNTINAIHPSSFVNLKVLRELRLDGNLLSAFPWEALRDMPRLRSLSLHNNRLSSLPAQSSLFLPHVTYLDLSSNRSVRHFGCLQICMNYHSNECHYLVICLLYWQFDNYLIILKKANLKLFCGLQSLLLQYL